MADADDSIGGEWGVRLHRQETPRKPSVSDKNNCGIDMANADKSISSEERQQRSGELSGSCRNKRENYWDNAIWLNGADGKTRRAEPNICLLAHGVPARVGKLRAYGNAIVPPLAAEVIKAFMEVAP